jgi:hypothetical protein
MSETSTTAMLVGTPDMFDVRSNAITATIPRDEIADALASEPPAELILDVLRAVPGREDAETRTVNVAWTQADLESLLDLPGAEAVTFYFDPAELERLLEEAEVEGHGLREAAVVLSIAAAAAVGASNAYAQPDPGGASSQAQVTVVGHDEATLTERGIGLQAIASTHDEASLTDRGIVVQPATGIHDEATLIARGIEPGTLPATHDEATLVARGIEPATLPATHDEATLVARGIEPATLPAIHDEATLVARGIEPGTPIVVGDTGSGFELASVEPSTVAAVTGGLAGAGLLIAAAAFATRRRQLGHP